MVKINPKKLLNSKWTALKPANKEKHFLITEIDFDEQNNVIHCIIEAVMTKRAEQIDWRTLKDGNLWIQGWK